MRYLTLENCEGLPLAKSLYNEYGRLIIGAKTSITHKHTIRLRNFGIYYLPILDSIDEEVPDDIVDERVKTEALSAVEDLDIDRSFEMASKLVSELVGNSALLENGFQSLKEYDINTADHSVNVAINAIAFGICMGLNITRLNNIGAGALLHDIGKCKIPLEILNSTEKLTKAQRKIINNHPQYGYEILDEDILVPASVKAIVYQHHENWDGTGYPRGLKEKEIYDLAAMIHICDVWDALISQRPYKECVSYKDAIEYMKEQGGKMFSPYYLKYFFLYHPIYAVGVEVPLSNNKTGVVIKNTKGHMLTPTVKILETGEIIDLRKSDIKIL